MKIKKRSGVPYGFDYAFRNNKGMYRVFSRDELEGSKTGKFLKTQIVSGRLSFMVLLSSKEDAESLVYKFMREAAVGIVNKSIDMDYQAIDKINSSIMKRIKMVSSITMSNSIEEIVASIKKSAGDTTYT